jgi:hypothetical protein
MLKALATNNSSLARWLRRKRARHVSSAAPVIVGGCQRSGTTLLRVILDSHPNIACGPESSLFTGGFLPHKLSSKFSVSERQVWTLHNAARDHAEFIESFFTFYAAERGKPRWADKTPQNVWHLEWILRHFPKARFIYMLRDGRDVVCSIRTHPRFRMVNGERVPTNIRRPLRPCINYWLEDTAEAMKWRKHPNFLAIRYEDIVSDTEPALRKLCEFIGEPWDPALLNFHAQEGPSRDASKFVANEAATQPLSQQAAGRWRKDLTPAEQTLFHRLAGARLVELGYAIDALPPPPALDATGAAVGTH